MKLFSSYSLYNQHLNNRVVMAPMTRSRATGNIANDLIAEYYAQRADAGLIITEGTSPSPNGLGYARIPGIASPEQTISWQRVTDAVHARNGKIFLQMMHSGRVGSKLNLPQGSKLLAPSAVAMSGLIWTDSHGEQPYEVPAEMTGDDVKSTISEYAQAARNAISAGFDGVEIHGANGYLITQFLDPGSNQRSDEFGGDADRRNRFALDVAVEVVAAIGSDRTGIRLSPYGVFNDMSGAYDGIAKQYVELSGQLGKLGLAYLHLVDHSAIGAPKPDQATVREMCEAFRSSGGRSIILSGGYDLERAEADLESGAADLIAFGRPFIANPDFVTRLRNASALAAPNPETFYTPGPMGYTDYPVLAEP
jgi:N-ethylmaleimide reductase